MTLGSLFDGIGGFPLAGVMCGITPVWASEIELFPMKVTAARFPDMKQLGSVTEINGAEIEPVDIITFGSPCQDLSVAGKQLGIHDGQRSNLFFEAVRIIKEMREADERTGRTDVDIRPRFAVWENVPGAFSSNKGADFQAVLQALASVRENGVSIPQSKKWGGAGCVVGNGWSIAWRVYDAQYWGVPQRRKRIYLVADFASERAGEILFEREGLRGDSAEGAEAREGTAADAEGGVGGSSLAFKEREGCAGGGKGLMANGDRTYSLVVDDAQMVCYPNVARTLTAEHDASFCADRGPNVVCYGVDCRNAVLDEEKTHTLQANISLNCTPSVMYDSRGNGDGATSPTLTGDHQNRVTDYTAVCVGNRHYTQQRVGEYAECGVGSTLMARDYKSASDLIVEQKQRKYIIRRLTPTECARLQGFPDWWCEGLGGSDSAIYKAYGNGLALPCAYDVLRRIAKEYDQTTL